MTKGRWVSPVITGCGVGYAVLTVLLVFYGRHYVDEGYYHIIAHLTSQGKLPYRDYLCVQAPLYPLIYGAIFKITGDGFVPARMLSGALSVLAFLTAVWASVRNRGDRAGAATAILIACQPFTLYFLTVIKLYALAALILAFFVFSLTIRSSVCARYCLSSVFLAVGSGVRISILPGLIVFWFITGFRTRSLRVTALTFLVSLAVLSAVFLPFYLISPDNFIYGNSTYHSQKEAFGLLKQWLHRFQSAASLSEVYLLHLLIPGTWLAFRRVKNQEKDHRDPDGRPVLIEGGLVLAVIAGVHFLSQAPYSFRYIPMILPAACVVIGGMAVDLEEILARVFNRRLGGFLLLSGILVFLARGKDDLGQIRPIGTAGQIACMAAAVETLCPPDRPVLVFNNSVAVQSQRNVIQGDEMNVLTYDPAWTQSRCESLRILNADMLEQMIRDTVFGAILITQYSFIGNFPVFYNPGETGARPRIMSALEEKYVKLRTFKGFGYLGEDADLYVVRTASDGADPGR